MQSVKYGHSFLGLNEDGQVSIINTNGNPYAHVVLRGGNGKPNYDAGSVAEAENALAKAKVSNKIMIDASHANSNKDPYLQPLVLKNITEQILDGNKSIVGIMVESHLKAAAKIFLKIFASLNMVNQSLMVVLIGKLPKRHCLKCMKL